MSGFDFRIRHPRGAVARFVESIWYARGTVPYRREQIAPTGSCVAVFVLGAPILEFPLGQLPQEFARGFLIGPHDRPVVNEPTGETFAVGIVTTTIGSRPVFGVDPTTLRGRVVELESAWTPARQLRRLLDAECDPEVMLDQVGAHVERHLEPDVSRIGRCEAAVASLEAHPTMAIADIARQAEISHAHLDREFARLTGLTPRVLARLLRMRRLLERIDVSGSPAWSDLASEFGWFDQAHLIRDFKRHTGVTPSDYVERQRRFDQRAEPTETAGFVPGDETRPRADINSVQDSS